MNILIERDIATEKRKLAKKKWDKIFNLSVPTQEVDAPEGVRLLDEGTVVDGDGNPWFYIRKGTLKRFYESLSDDFVGYITLAHIPFDTFPFSLGTWRKSDLSLIDNGDGFYGLNVTPNIDNESIFVKELQRLSHTVGISVEMHTKADEKMSRKLKLEIVDEVDIHGFSVVGNAGNVNSSGINFGGAKS